MAMDLENPDCVTRYVIRRIDPAVFYWIFCCFRQLSHNFSIFRTPYTLIYIYSVYWVIVIEVFASNMIEH